VKRRACVVPAIVVAVATTIACGKKGDPLPPLRPVPAMVSGFAADRIGTTVTIRFATPTANQDASTPSATQRIDLFALTMPASAPAPNIDQLVTADNVVSAVPVRRSQDGDEPNAPKTGPGDSVTYTDTVSLPADGGPFVRYYAAAGWAGRRRGPVSAMLSVPLGTGPSAPSAVTPVYDEKSITLSWQASGAGQRFVVDRVSQGAAPTRVTPEAIAATEAAVPVQFGVEQCFVVRTVEVIGAVTLVGDPTSPACVTPVDRFPPAPPSELRGFPAETGIELTWTASSTADAAAYVVLRAEGTSDTLQRLTATPVTATQYRDEAVRSGVTYTYAVIAIDRATPPNESRPSNRETVTARQFQKR
jgi:hypothetical protein